MCARYRTAICSLFYLLCHSYFIPRLFIQLYLVYLLCSLFDYEMYYSFIITVYQIILDDCSWSGLLAPARCLPLLPRVTVHMCCRAAYLHKSGKIDFSDNKVMK